MARITLVHVLEHARDGENENAGLSDAQPRRHERAPAHGVKHAQGADRHIGNAKQEDEDGDRQMIHATGRRQSVP